MNQEIKSTSIVLTRPVSAVCLADGWHEVSEFSFYGDSESPLITKAGASWLEPNRCRYSCPLPAILALREGLPVSIEPEPAPEYENRKLARAKEWLLQQLQDGEWHAIKILRRDARETTGISFEMLNRAKDTLQVKVNFMKVGKEWYWQIAGDAEPASELANSEKIFDFNEA